MHRPPSQHDHLARLSCSQASPRCGRGSSASGHQHRTAARCSCRMETAVRSAWIGSATIAHVSKTPLLPRHGGLAQCGKSLAFRRPNLGRQERNFWMRRQSGQNRRQRQRTPAETIKGRTDSGNPGTNGLFEPDRKTPGSAGLGGGDHMDRDWMPTTQSNRTSLRSEPGTGIFDAETGRQNRPI